MFSSLHSTFLTAINRIAINVSNSIFERSANYKFVLITISIFDVLHALKVTVNSSVLLIRTTLYVLYVLILEREENRRTHRKTLGAKTTLGLPVLPYGHMRKHVMRKTLKLKSSYTYLYKHTTRTQFELTR